MSAEIQASLFILVAEVAGVTTLVAVAAGIIALMRRKACVKAATALRDAARRLPDGIATEREKALLGEFARAYLSRDEGVLAALPSHLLSLRKAYEDAQAPAAPADTAQSEALQAELDALTARAEASEQALRVSSQQLEEALATINALVQEYGRGRGQMVAPTAEALLQALMNMGHAAPAPAEEASPASVEDEIDRETLDEAASGTEPVADTPHTTEGKPVLQDEEVIALTADESVSEEVGAAKAEPTVMADEDDIDALLAAAQAEVPAAELPAAPDKADQAMDLAATDGDAAEPVAGAVIEEPKDLDLSVEAPAASEPQAPDETEQDDALDDLDIEALLDAELERQSRLLQPASGFEEDLDLSRTEENENK